jgi:signal recognition particle receptor subunit beta
LWRHYYASTEALIYVVDSADVDRLDEAAAQLHDALANRDLRGIPLLVFANRQDLREALPASEISERLELRRLKDRQYFVQACCATTGDGLDEGFAWLSWQ